MADTRFVLFTLIAVIPLGSLDASAADPQGVAPAGTMWVLERGRNIPTRLEKTPQLRMEGQKLSGSTGCNSFTASVVDKTGKRVAIEQVALTRKLCAAKLDQVEAAFVRALGETEYLEQKPNRLTFLSGKREPLLIWTRTNKSAAARAVSGKRYTGVRHRQHYAGARHRRSALSVGYRGCRGRLTGAPTLWPRVF